MKANIFASLFLAKYPKNAAVLSRLFLSLSGSGCPSGSGSVDDLPAAQVAQLAEINTEDIKTFHQIRAFFCDPAAGICRNSAAQYLSQIKTILTQIELTGEKFPTNWKKVLNLKQLRSHGIYVDSDRLTELESLDVFEAAGRADTAKTLRIAQLLALISARTGCRASDVVRLKPTNIRENLLTYVPKKTKDTSGKVVVVPVGPKTKGWIAEVTEMTKDEDLTTENGEKAFYRKYERGLKALVKMMPWDEEVIVFEANEEKVKKFNDCITSHTMRHSFATNMYLDEEVGGDIYAIAQMLGHSSVDMTMTYICVPFNEKKMSKVKYFE